MERESFCSPEVARLLNAAFVPIKVDREERPDLDAIYMQYVQASTGGGGWPLNVFLTPELEPVFGGTYFPGPNSLTAGLSGGSVDSVGFLEVLEKMRNVWLRQEARCRASAQEITQQLRHFAEEGVHSHDGHPHKNGGLDPEHLDLELLEEAYEVMARGYDRENYGFGTSPKFPVAIKLRFLLQLGHWPRLIQDIVGHSECVDAQAMAIGQLRRMARGGIRDHVGYGFARYSVTADWSLPHFEKMLPDQALLLDAYLDAYLLTHDQEMLGAVHDLATYLTTPPIQRTDGGFFSSEDADSPPSHSSTDSREGAFYVWTRNELSSVLGADTADVFTRFYGVKVDGNVPQEYDAHDELLGQNVLVIATDPDTLSKNMNIPESQIVATLRSARQTLRNHRDATRPRPILDAKLVTAWNGLAIAALARAAAHLRRLNPDAARSWLDTATSAAKFLRDTMWDAATGTLWRVWCDGARGNVRGFADDYVATAHAALELYAATFDTAWLRWADALADELVRRFAAPEGGFYTAAGGAEGDGNDLLLRLKPGMDNSEPSANALAASVLFRLASLLGGDERYDKLARGTVLAFEPEIEHAPAGFPGLLGAVAWAHVGGGCVWLVGDGGVRKEGGGELRLDMFLGRLREGLGLGRTVLRVRKGDTWLRERNALVGATEVKEGNGLMVMLCEAGVCREVKKLDDL